MPSHYSWTEDILVSFSDTFEIDNILRKPMPEITLLGVTLDNKLNFKSHASNICKEAKKLSALLNLSGRGGGLRGPDDQTHNCQSETSYSMMSKLGDF